MTDRRLIEEAFPLKKVSEDSKHEKMCHAGHIKSLHIWPARRPLAACRAAIIAALMPDPGDDKARDDLCRRIGNITRWKSENGPDLQYFRDEIRKARGGCAPKVLDMFAGGGAIPLEAMRLGCDVTAIDYNPVAWFILKCTLEFPQKLAGKTWPLPTDSRDRRPPTTDHSQESLLDLGAQGGDLAAHVRYWGNWVLERAREELALYYPTIDDKPTSAYLWARTVPCQDPKCGGTVPLLKTLWICSKAAKRRALRLKPDSNTRRVDFEVWEPDPKDTVEEGTMSSKLRCPFCGTLITKDYIKACGKSGQLKTQITAVSVEGKNGREYRPPTMKELESVQAAADIVSQVAAQVPYGLPIEPLPASDTSGAGRAFTVPQYGFKTWGDLFTPRQLLSLLVFTKWTREACSEMLSTGYSPEQSLAVTSYLACVVDKVADYNSTIVTWQPPGEKGGHTFARWALPITWDFVEPNPIRAGSASYENILDWICKPIEDISYASASNEVSVLNQSAKELAGDKFDAVVTDPPYYDAIPYADLSDFFYVWLRRSIGDRFGVQFVEPLSPKVDELVQHANHYEGNQNTAKLAYEDGMAKVFQQACDSLVPDGRMVIVFAHKEPDAWETLVAAMIKTGFVVTASWPIDTEMGNRTRSMNSAALSSSVWLVCRKRPADAGIGRYVEVKRKMQERITERLRYFWDQGISGPDFMWAAVGPALESYSTYGEVRRMDGSPFTVSEFLKEVRRLVADFALGRILHGASTEGLDEWTRYYLMHRSNFRLVAAPVGECILLAQGYGLDLNELKGPRGFIAKGKAKKAVGEDEDADSPLPSETGEGLGGGGGSDIRLLSFEERKRDDLGEPHPSGGLPLIDMLHRLMRLWQAGDTEKLTAYVQQHGLSQNDLFWAVAQAILEMADPKTKERALLEALVAWGRGKPAHTADQPSLI
jgi:putative DNA methylase